MSKRYEAHSGYGSYQQAHIYDNEKRWIHGFYDSFEEAQRIARVLNLQEEAERESNSILLKPEPVGEKVRGIRI